MFNVQKSVGSPSFRITCGMTLWMWSIYLAQPSGVRFSQYCLMPFTKSSFFLGFIFVARNCFIDDHTFSIGFRSGDEAGVFITESIIPCSVIQSFVDLLVCLLSLSCKIYIIMCTLTKKNVFVKYYALRSNKVCKSYLAWRSKRSQGHSPLESFERASLVQYACQI